MTPVLESPRWFLNDRATGEGKGRREGGLGEEGRTSADRYRTISTYMVQYNTNNKIIRMFLGLFVGACMLLRGTLRGCKTC